MICKSLLLACLLAVAAVFGSADDKKSPTKITGFLLDNMCAEAAQGGEAEEAEGHMVSCALMEMCVKSGYAVISEGKTYKLDEKGNKLALKVLRDTRVRQGLRVTVAGTLEGDLLRADTIAESR